MINIVGLGYGEIDDLTIKTYKILKESKNIYIKNTDLKIIKSLEEEGILFKNSSNLFKDIRNISKNNEVVYATIGSPSDNDKSVKDIIKLCKEKNIDYKIYPAAGIKELIQSCLNKTIEDITIINSNCIEEADIRKHSEVVIKDISSKYVALKIKTKLENVYDKDIKVYYIINKDRKCLEIKLNKIDDITDFSEFNIIYIPKNSKGKKDIDDLIEIVKILRGENGCPWDKEQTHESIKRDIIEESYEVFDAIEQNNKEALIEELGDVLFQVIFHASLGIDDSEFDMLDITDGISNKMIYRHPHVFGDINVKDTAEVLVNWDELKKGEKHFETLTDELNGVAKAFPALLRAKKIQKKAKKVGFDWDNVEDAIEKIKEELNEVIDVYKSENMVRIKEEIGDLLFSCVNVSRFLNVDAEDALNLTTDKFIKRFSYMEKKSKENNLSLESMSLEDMDKLWDEAKKLEKKQ
ncbi:tetrapyrrole methylase family protein / MazG family protein [Clostridium sp. DSM 8431]|uniref:nucleoside triphosphate pyrophosphohydrolase n=1 Tax=Clostridium sp. DSM 8431 TaxID=1761781 RepID=UPI0008E517EA|nr:nucleoside triphosphate pyrophosphohydrolase [Clostridium sp. DSM 8431]SFU67761.1 tetrapyrrole methylase family protein / MazG family protein [Clostridium sp. DSM 8431]